MDITTADLLKEELMNRDPEFRELARDTLDMKND